MIWRKRRQKLLRVVAAIGFVLLANAQTKSASTDALRTPDKDTIAALEADIPKLLHEANVPGISLVVIRDGKTYWLHSFGVKDEKTKQLVSEDTIFEAASLSPFLPTAC